MRKPLTRKKIREYFQSGLPKDWKVAEPQEGNLSALDVWTALLDENEMKSVSSGWLKRMTRTVASLAMALSDYDKKAPSGKREIDDASLFLASILVSHACHGDGGWKGDVHTKGRVCSGVTLETYRKENTKHFDGIKGRFNTRFKDSGLPPIP